VIWVGRAELLKINHYKAPRDKMICVLNCCKVIFGQSIIVTITIISLKTRKLNIISLLGLIRHVAGWDNTSADAFLPILIFVVLRANPDNMISNIE
jgi:hypothetical protein